MAKGTFVNYVKRGVYKVFKNCLFRNEKHFIECYKEHFPLEFDNISMERVAEDAFILHVDFGDLQVDMRLKMHKSTKCENYVLDAIE